MANELQYAFKIGFKKEAQKDPAENYGLLSSGLAGGGSLLGAQGVGLGLSLDSMNSSGGKEISNSISDLADDMEVKKTK